MRRVLFLLLTLVAHLCGAAGESLSLADQRLLSLLEREKALFEEMRRRSTDPEGAVRDNSSRAQRLATDFEAFVREFPNHAAGHVAFARFLQRTGRDTEAMAFYRSALKIDPKLPVANQQLGNWLAANDKPLEALPLLLRAVDGAPDRAAYHFDLGSILSHHREVFVREKVLSRPALEAQMLHAFKRAAELDPENLDVAFRRAESLADLEKPDWKAAYEAWLALELRVQANSLLHDAVLLQLARSALELGRVEDARRYLSEVPPESPLKNSRDRLRERLPAS